MGQEEQKFEYDRGGNLLKKAGAVYTYPDQGAGAIRPHAVQRIDGLGQFAYDGNGNLLTGAGRTASWTTFDMPLRVSKGDAWAEFKYGPEHQRTRQDRSDGSSVIYAGVQTVESKAGQITLKTYWPAGIGVEIDRPDVAATQLNWTYTDRLGSPIALTDQDGAVRERLAYDAWGKRREIDTGAVPDSLDGRVDNRGFTNHEMLDKLDLVHMNGRVYDPLVARFLSGDPLIDDPNNGQSYNRFSYVLNNPTNLTDPTGFAPKGSGRICEDNPSACSTSPTIVRVEQTPKEEDAQPTGKMKVSANTPRGTSANPTAGNPNGGDSSNMQQVVVTGKRPLRMDRVPTYEEARAHWQNGEGRSIRIPTSAVDFRKFRVSSAPNVVRAMNLLTKDGAAQVTWSSRRENVSFETTGSDFPTLGTITLKVEGQLTRTGDEFLFSGTLKAFDDTYDFNSDWSRPWRNILTAGARADHGPGTTYDIQFRGAVHVDRKIK